jgi:tight adherence protein B
MAAFPWIVSGLGALGIGLAGLALGQWLVMFIPEKKAQPSPAPSQPAETPTHRSFKMDSVTRWILVSVIACLALVLFGNPAMGLFFLLVVLMIGAILKLGPGILEKQKKDKKLKTIQEIFPQSLGMMIQALKSGQTMQQVLEYLSQECPEPLRGEYRQVCRDMALGASADRALTFMAERYDGFDDFRQFIESYRISRITGANLTRLLEVLLENLQEKDRLVRKRDAMTAQARLSGMLMGCLPFLLGLVFFVMDPNLMIPLFVTPQGWAILFTACLLEAIGFLWIRQLLALEF